jgi:hypothetical protein
MLRMRATRHLLPLLALLAATRCSNAYLQNEGRYELTLTELLRDDCGLLPPEGRLWGGTLSMAGTVVYMNLDLLDMKLIGFFREGGEDRFRLDGDAQSAQVVANGRECTVDQVTVRLEGATRCPTQFDGTLRVRSESLREPQCTCELWARFRAVQGGAVCAGAP